VFKAKERLIDIMVKLYDLDAYATEFDAKVVSCEAVTYNKQDVYAVI